MAFSTIARKKAAPLAALIRKLALNDARVIQAASIQATRSFNAKAMDASRGVFEPFSEPDHLNRTGYFKRWGSYELEDENILEIRMAMPGLGKEHVKLRLNATKNTLIIEGDGGEEKGEEEGARWYSRSIKLPYWYKLKEAETEMKNGILKIVVPKIREEDRKGVSRINVR